MNPHSHSRIAACAAVVTLLGGYLPAHAGGQATHTVTIEAMQFSPATIEVNAGDTIVWRNGDPFPHTATAQDRSFDSGEIPPGGSWKFKAVKKGLHPYVCTLHPTMKGTVNVR